MVPTGHSHAPAKIHFRCDCGWIGSSPNERETHEAFDSMYGRRPTLVECVERSCPECGDTVEETAVCLGCRAAEPADGCDHCANCLEAIEHHPSATPAWLAAGAL